MGTDNQTIHWNKNTIEHIEMKREPVKDLDCIQRNTHQQNYLQAFRFWSTIETSKHEHKNILWVLLKNKQVRSNAASGAIIG